MLQIKSRLSGEVIYEVDANDLSGGGSSDERFVGINLRDADLRGLSLFYGDFMKADLEGADLSYADLSNASFTDANLRRANLLNARTITTGFDGADLRGSTLVGNFFWLCSFDQARFEDADIAETSFLECEGLRNATGLDRLARFASVGLDRQTLVDNVIGLPNDFLLKAGYTTVEIEMMRSLYKHNDGLLSCFVSHAESDMDFVKKLLYGLRRHDVHCWHYKADLRGGRPWREQIGDAIRSHDRLLLVCSRKSLYRANVAEEILFALEEQRTTGKQKLFPIRLDDHILSASFMDDAREKVVTRQWRDNWVPSVLEEHIPDFSSWQSDPMAYRAEFSRLLDALRLSAQN